MTTRDSDYAESHGQLVLFNRADTPAGDLSAFGVDGVVEQRSWSYKRYEACEDVPHATVTTYHGLHIVHDGHTRQTTVTPTVKRRTSGTNPIVGYDVFYDADGEIVKRDPVTLRMWHARLRAAEQEWAKLDTPGAA